jgi:hypothetical protein
MYNKEEQDKSSFQHKSEQKSKDILKRGLLYNSLHITMLTFSCVLTTDVQLRLF